MKKQTGLYKNYVEMVAAQPLINSLKVIAFHSKNKHGNVIINCVCACGKEVQRYFSDVNNQKVHSCGCVRKSNTAKMGIANRMYDIDDTTLSDKRFLNYLTGIYAADGVVYQNNSSELCFEKTDTELLEKIVKKLKYTGVISQNKYRSRLIITNKYFVTKLAEGNITPNKSKTYSVPDHLRFDSDFWRGYLDGDGCYYSYPTITGLSIVGTLSTITAFKEYCGQFIEVKSNPCEIKRCPGTYVLAITGRQIVPVLTALYKKLKNVLYMERKYQKMKSILDLYHTNTSKISPLLWRQTYKNPSQLKTA